jgi:hypothetical protein
MGHEVKLLPAQHMKAFLLRDKTDAMDAQAICPPIWSSASQSSSSAPMDRKMRSTTSSEVGRHDPRGPTDAGHPGDLCTFKSARQLASWVGPVPRHVGTGGKTQQLGISKRGDTY